MDVSLRHWPIFVTGLLLGAAGTMSMGLHLPTQAELAAAGLAPASPPAVAAVMAVPVASAAVAPTGADSAELAQERMLAAAESFRAQEALAAVAAPDALLAQAPKPRVRRVVKEADPAPVLASVDTETRSSPAIAIAPSYAPELPEASTDPRSPASVMGASAGPD